MSNPQWTRICQNAALCTVVALQQRIENLEWDWKRWPALKTFELEKNGYSDERDLLIDFKQCPTLKTVIFVVCIDIADFFSNCPKHVAVVRKLAFNPQFDITQFCLDNIWLLNIFEQNDEVFKMINENVKGLKELMAWNLSYLNLVCMDALIELHIFSYSSSELKIAGLKNLKTLTVVKLAQLDNLVGIDALLELSVTNVFGHELKEYDLSNIAKRFKNLQKCDIILDSVDDLSQPEEYAQIVQDVFQNSATTVKIVFNYNDFPYILTKEPFQRCALTTRNNLIAGSSRDLKWGDEKYTANAYRQTTDKLMFKSVISTVR